MKRQGYLRLPAGWTRQGQRGLGPFVTYEVFGRPDGSFVIWESRRHRKRRPRPAGSTWWAPSALGWWTGVLFALGSLCFALGALPVFATEVGAGDDSLTYFAGSLLFTSAAFLLYCEVAWAHQLHSRRRLTRVGQLLRPHPERIDWLAAIIQLAGTIFFNLSTGHAAFAGATQPSALNQLVWRPDALGSICFLASSWLSWGEVCHGVSAWRPRQLSWYIAGLNLVGSIAFGVSAVASRVQPNGSLESLAFTNLGTLVGAVCFLLGAVLLLPERTEGDDAANTIAAEIAGI